jgi:hypothetical protein
VGGSYGVSFIVCIVLCAVFCLSMVCYFVLSVLFVLSYCCTTATSKNRFAVKINK